MTVRFDEGPCVVDGMFGQFVPQRAAMVLDLEEYGISQEDIDVLLAGPSDDPEANETYWFTLANSTTKGETLWNHATSPTFIDNGRAARMTNAS